MASASQSHSRFGLKSLFVLAAIAAILVRAGIWLDERSNPRTDLVGKVALKQGNKPAANMKVWACLAYRDLESLELVKPDPTRPPPPSRSDRTVYVTTNEAGEYRFLSLKRGQHYTLGIEDDDWVAPTVEVDTTNRVQTVPQVTASKGAIVSVRVANLQPQFRTLPPLSLKVSGPTFVFETNFKKVKKLSPDGRSQLRVAPGLHSAWLDGDGISVLQFPIEAPGRSLITTMFYADGQLHETDVAFDSRNRVLTEITHNKENGHFYVGVPFQGSWMEAKTFANSCEVKNLKGHLLTITNDDEHRFVERRFGALETWTAGTNARRDGVWKWDDGPEQGQIFYQSDNDQSSQFQRWAKGEPDQALVEHYMIWDRGRDGAQWRNSVQSYEMKYLIVEFSPVGP